MPNLLALMKEGTYTLSAKTISPSLTLPAHASIFTSMCPDKHGIDFNEYLPEKGYANGDSIFDLAHEAGLKTVMIIAVEKLRQIIRPESIDVFKFTDDSDSIVAKRAAPIIADGFDLMFIHLLSVDILGHKYGWLSDEQLIGVADADEAIGTILAALDGAGLRQGTLIIVTSDHGGLEKVHGGDNPAEMTVPWILSEPSLNPRALARPISVIDTGATAAYALNLPIPSTWDGIPALEAFGETSPIRSSFPCQ